MSGQTGWVSVGELAHAFAPNNNTPRSSDELVGKTLELYLENGQVLEHRFETKTQLV